MPVASSAEEREPEGPFPLAVTMWLVIRGCSIMAVRPSGPSTELMIPLLTALISCGPGLLLLVELIEVAFFHPIDCRYWVCLGQASMSPRANRGAQSRQRLLTALQVIAKQEAIQLAKNEPFGPTGCA